MLAYIFLIAAFAARFLVATIPGAWHFTPVGAALLYFGAKRPAREMGVPVVVFALSDIALNRFVYQWPLDALTFSTTIYYLAAVLIGRLLREKQTVGRVAGAAIGGSATFFVISNFTTWLGTNMYPHTLEGLLQCLVAAIPFFRNTFVSDLVFTAAFFGLPALFAAREKAYATVK